MQSLRRLSTTTIRRSSSAPPVNSHVPYFFSSLNVPFEGTIPAFRVLDSKGEVLKEVQEGEEWVRKGVEEISESLAVNMYTTMLKLPIVDSILYNSQRQGKIAFYMTSHGEEGAVVGSAAAFSPTDEVFAQYREVGVLLWRGFSLTQVMAQCFASNSDDSTGGKQMPMHFGSKRLHYQTISSPLATQIPQAAGAAYAIKRMKQRGEKRGSDCVVCYFGDGAASEGDFHAGLNMASVLGGPIVFFVRNNGFAISTPTTEQFRGDGIASRGPGYGIETIRVDGNDPIAVYLATKEARRRATEGEKPVLIEALSYRVGHHSTSDDSSAYRSSTEVENWKKADNPIYRMRHFLQASERKWWDDEREESVKKEWRKEVLKELGIRERERKPPLQKLFEDVWAGEERPMREQKEELKRLVRKWGEDENWKRELASFEGGKDKFLKS
ncbi:branched-chain alpha-keto acid dehydrogenase E1-alpha subunit [Atractiella rhizophila]|nr:branched-chain alpha-keto acid dehydrogenase E1-alpha subunit [Atractiella rhizophila]